MKLHYKILWIDDQIEDYIDMGIKSEFESYLDNLGFIPTVETFENGNKAETSINTVKYDLILSDYNIEGANEQGDTLIQKIRDGGVFTEVLFYSAQENFDEIAKNLYRDRVSFFSLVGDEGMREFRHRTFRLIELTVQKLQELNSIRGLVMSETSELDNIIEDILAVYLSNDNEETVRLRQYIIGIIIESSKGNLAKAGKLDGLDNLNLIKSRIFDADKKSRSINKLLEIKGMHKQPPYNDFYERYKNDVLDKRNDLAHAKSDTIDGIEYLILSKKDGEHPEKFDQETCIIIRKKLKEYSTLLKAIHQSVVVKN